MLYLQQIMRLFTIYRVIVRYGLDELLLSWQVLRPLRLFLYITPGYWLRNKTLNRAERIRLALEDLGPIFIKFGQILSTRRDLLPDDFAFELAKLQDRVKPFCGDAARQIIEQDYRRPIHEIFSEFNTTPMAAASIAQVHAARLHDGREVVVKVVRPNIKKKIRSDIALMYLLAKFAQRYWADGKRLRPVEVVAEFEQHLYDELDLLQEASNCALLRRNFMDSPLLYVPEVEWDYTLKNVMVLERISGVPVGNIEELKAKNVNLKKLAEYGVEIFFAQVFRDNFFHADMHPGNIFVDIKDPENPHYIAIDFGIMGTLSHEDQRYLAENFLAFFQRDYRRVAELHVHSGWVPEGTSVEAFEGAIRTVCEPIFDKPLKEISFGLVLLRLFQTARRFNMEVQPQLVLLQKTLLNIEGLGRQLYPDLDLWKTAKPFLETWMAERLGWRAFADSMKRNLPLWAEKLPELPILLHEQLTQHQKQQQHAKHMEEEIKGLRQQMTRQSEQHNLTLLATGFIISASIFLSLEVQSPWNLSALGTILGIGGSFVLFVIMLRS